ncbi:hypothetical protein Psi02_42390 [Planotetraspora silvatica]|uniref:Uncharacterized protein n=1 Tax=Planotetraspora silvatica TaxID=234614 RepID=A0A8J3UNV4_9ACTN|nr:hypothetical protein Psi02_42390 [Planotetraspora silvatica]
MHHPIGAAKPGSLASSRSDRADRIVSSWPVYVVLLRHVRVCRANDGGTPPALITEDTLSHLIGDGAAQYAQQQRHPVL